MKWAVLFLVLLGAILYIFGAFTPSPDNASKLPESAALTAPEQKSGGVQDPTAPPSLQATEPNAAFNGHSAESHASPESLSSKSPSLNAVQPSNNTEHLTDTWGQLLRGTPVHSGPSVSSAKLGYASVGTEMRLLERKSRYLSRGLDLRRAYHRQRRT
jgi:hypothetical protein